MRQLICSATVAMCIVATLGCAVGRQGIGNTVSNQVPKNSFEKELNLARLSERHGNMGDAIKIYRIVIEKDPSNTLAHHRLGVISAQNDDFEQAMHYFQAAEQNGASSAEFLTDIGFALFLQRDVAGAEERYRQALSVDPEYRRARNNLGVVLAEQGKVKQSFEEFNKAVSEAEAYSNLAFVQSQTGAPEEAELNFHRALQLNQNLKPAGEALIQLSAHKSRPKHTPENTALKIDSQPQEVVKIRESG